MLFILSQVFVGLSLIMATISIFSKEKRNILLYRIPNTLFYATSFALQGLWAAFGNMIFSMIRFITYYIFKDRNKKPNIYVLIIFIIILIIINITLWSGYLGLLPAIAGLVLAWAYWQDNEKIIRISLLFSTTCWIVYNILVLNYMGIVLESFLQVLQISAFIRYDILKKESLIK